MTKVFKFITIRWLNSRGIHYASHNCDVYLGAIGETISYSDLILYSLYGLDWIYNPFVSSLIMRIKSVRFDMFHSELLAYEKC